MAEQKDNFEFEIEGEEREVTPVQKADAAPQQNLEQIPDNNKATPIDDSEIPF